MLHQYTPTIRVTIAALSEHLYAQGRWWVQETNTNEGTKARQQQTSKFRAVCTLRSKHPGCLVVNILQRTLRA